MLMLATLGSSDTLETLWIWLNGIDPQVALLLVFILLFLAGCGLPMPEDIPLVFTGILIGLPSTQSLYGGWIPAMLVASVVCYTSILTGDVVAYTLGRRYGHAISRVPPFKWAMSKKRIDRLDRWFVRFGNWTVFFGRMVAGIRFVTFVMAGMARMPLHKFIAFDTLGAVVTVPAWICLGYILGTHFQRIAEWMSMVSTTTWIVLASVVLVFVGYRWVRRARRTRKNSRDIEEF